jgi:hypothetical protein
MPSRAARTKDGERALPSETAHSAADEYVGVATWSCHDAAMLRSGRLSYLLAVVTAWPPLYLLASIPVFVVLAVDPSTSPGGPPTPFVALLVGHAFTLAVTVALIPVYVVDVLRNPDLATKQDMRILWVVLAVVLSGYAMVVYWWLYLRPGSDAFQRRQTAVPSR